MDIGSISTRYAKALLEYTEHSGVSGRVYDEMGQLAESFSLVPRLKTVLANPLLDRVDKIALLKSIFGGDVSRELERFFNMVVRNHREGVLQSMALTYVDLYRRAKNIARGHLETAAPLPEQTLERMKDWIRQTTHGEAELETRVDPDLIGGFIFRIDFRQIDASVSSELKRIRRHFTNENRQLI
jgi:F-type H+-transporting ATPase subunit delta